MFPLPAIQAQFKKYVLVRLYVEDKNHADLQDQMVKRSDLPSYVVAKPDGKTIVGFVGYETNPAIRVDSFAKFLNDSQSKALE